MAESDWSQPSSWSTGGGGMWGAPQGGMQSPYGGGYGMQSPYGGFGGGYGGFGGGMPYGGGYGMQSSYGAPMPYGGGYGMQSPYGGGYGMQSPYGGMSSPYGGQMYGGYGGMQSPYSAYGMPQQQSMMAAPQTTATAADPQTAEANLDPIKEATEFFEGKLDVGGTQVTEFRPWENLAQEYEKLFPEAQKEYFRQRAQGPLGFDPSSEAGLRRMEQLAGAANPLVGGATNAVTGITSGENRIDTGGMFGSMYDNPGITGQQQYQDMAHRDAIGNAASYNQAVANPISSGNYDYLYGNTGIDPAQYQNMYSGQPGIDTSLMQNVYGGAGGQGSLAGGMFGRTASGEMVNSNPYREQAIQQAMGDTADQVKATMSQRGRFGSDAYGDAMGKALGNVATTARMQGYDTDTQNMMAAAQGRSQEQLARQGIGQQAAQSIMNAGGQNWQNRLAALQGLTGAQNQQAQTRLAAAGGRAGIDTTNIANRLAAAQGISDIEGQNYQAQLGALGQMNTAQQMANQQRLAALQGQTGVQGQNLQNRMQAAGMAPAMQGLRYDDASRMMQAGAAREAMAQQQNDFGWQQMGQYRGMLGNLPGAAGQTTEGQQKPWWQQALGLGASLGGIWGGLGGGG